MDKEENTMRIFNSAGYHYAKEHKHCGVGQNYWHPGYAWAITRKAYEKIGGLYDKGILGSGDNIMMLSLLGNGLKSLHDDSTDGYKQTIINFEKKISTLRFGYVPGTMYHYFHGSKVNRKYTERWQILVNYNYDPLTYITYDQKGIIIPTNVFSQELADEIMNYFNERNEDE